MIDNLKLDALREQLTPEGKAAFDIGFEKACRMHFAALRRISPDKAFRLPTDAAVLQKELLKIIQQLIDEERDPKRAVMVPVKGGSHG